MVNITTKGSKVIIVNNITMADTIIKIIITEDIKVNNFMVKEASAVEALACSVT